MAEISRRAYQRKLQASSWEEIWEAGPYYERISELLEDAEHHAIFAGWQIDSRLPMTRPHHPALGSGNAARLTETLRAKVIRLCERKPGFEIYFLIWDHAYFYVLERETWQGRVWEDVHPRVHFIFDNRHPFGAAHHEKIAIIDGKTAFVGGIDLCDERWDSPQHLFFDPRRSLNGKTEHHGPYHDLAVQVRGPVCAEIHEHVARRWKPLSSIPFPEAPKPEVSSSRGIQSGHQVYMSRTIAMAPIVREIEFLFRDLIRVARKRVILEGQYYWSREVNDFLIAKIREMRGTDFEVILILADIRKLKSLTRQMELHELSLLERLQSAASEAAVRLTLGTPYIHPVLPHDPPLPPRPIYIHSKVIIVDDRYLSIGSANFATRALRVDTEVTLTLEATTVAEQAHIRRFARQVLDHWRIDRIDLPIEGAHDNIRLHRFHPTFSIRGLLRGANLTPGLGALFPWRHFFDPLVPWFYRIAIKLRRNSGFPRQRPLAFASFPLCLVVCATGTAFSELTVWMNGHDHWAWVAAYSAIFSSAWLLPIPFLPLTAFGALHLGAPIAAECAIPSFWVTSLSGYFLARFFPVSAAAFYGRAGACARKLPRQVGRRSFPSLVAVLADPRVSLRSKIAFQGLYCVPLPWFALAHCLFLAGWIYMICRIAREFGHGWVGDRLALSVLTAISLFGIACVIRARTRRSCKGRGSEPSGSAPRL